MKTQTDAPKSKFKKVYNIVSTIVVLLVFLFLVAVVGFVLWQRRSGGDASLFGYYMFDVVSDSMEPTINKGDVIISKRVKDVNSLKEGDVITFRAPSGTFKGYNITHRIIEIERDEDGNALHIKTKGDNPEVDVDNWQLKPSDVKAKFVKVSPFIAGFKNFISNWYGYVVLIALPLTLVGALLIVGYVKDKVALAKEEEKKVSVDDLSDEEKRKLLENYLASPSEDVVSETNEDGVSVSDKDGASQTDEDGASASDEGETDASQASDEAARTTKDEGGYEIGQASKEILPQGDVASDEKNIPLNGAENEGIGESRGQ